MTVRTSFADIPSLATSVVQWIAGNIIDGRWAPSERLNEVHIAEELGVSRAPVREALRTLGEQGMVTHVPRVGSVVNEFTPQTVEHVYVLRAVIERWYVTESVERLSDQASEAMPRLIQLMEDALSQDDYPSFYAYSWRMREILYSSHPNTVALDEVRRLRARLHTLPNVLHSVSDMAEWTLDKHKELVEAALAGKAEEAGRLIVEMLLRSSEMVREGYEARIKSASAAGTDPGAVDGSAAYAHRTDPFPAR